MNNNFTRTSFQLRKLQTSDFCRPSNSENIAVFVYFGCLSTTIIDVIFMISSTRSKSKNNRKENKKRTIQSHYISFLCKKMRSNVYATTFERTLNLNIYFEKDIFTSSTYRSGS